MKILILTIFVSFYALSATVVPFERDISRVQTFAFMMSNNGSSLYFNDNFVGDENDNLYHFGFSFQNKGPNKIVTSTPEGIDYPHRDFQFTTDDGSRRDTYLWITDYNGSGYVSDRFESLIVFLPRNNQMHIEEAGSELVVTISTGEEVRYSKESKMILSGVLSEGSLDFQTERTLRKFPVIQYSGKGLMIRADARGADPRLTKKVQILKSNLPPCLINASVFWTQEDFPKFKFIHDEDAYRAIQELCGSEYSK